MSYQSSISSGEKTADAIIYTGKCYVTGLEVITDGTNDARVILYSGTSTSGTVICEVTVVGVDNYGGRVWKFPVECSDGIYADVNGTGASYVVEYITESSR